MSGGPVFVVTGTSGAGKGTLEKLVLARVPELALAVSATTRRRRPGEEDGREYWFLDEREFARLLEGGDFLEHVVFPWGQRVGTLRREIDRIRAMGRAPLLDLETEGARFVGDTVPESVTIFVDAPTFEELERRLRRRATESEGEIEQRLELARRQREQAGDFDFVIVNDDVERAVEELQGIVTRALAEAAASMCP